MVKHGAGGTEFAVIGEVLTKCVRNRSVAVVDVTFTCALQPTVVNLLSIVASHQVWNGRAGGEQGLGPVNTSGDWVKASMLHQTPMTGITDLTKYRLDPTGQGGGRVRHHTLFPGPLPRPP